MKITTKGANQIEKKKRLLIFVEHIKEGKIFWTPQS